MAYNVEHSYAASVGGNDNQSDFGGREIQSLNGEGIVPSNNLIAQRIRSRSSHHHSVRSSAGPGKSRESFAASLWHSMNDHNKIAFNVRRFVQLFAGVLIATCGGAFFSFGIFSNKIKETARLSQSDMTTITTAGTLVGCFTFPAGVLYDYFGPPPVLVLCTVCFCSGFSLLALIFKEVITPTVYSVSVANALIGWGIGFMDCGTILTNLFNFPINRGEVLIIQKTFLGLGSTFLSLIFDGFFGASENYIGYAVFVCLFMLVGGTFGTIVTRMPKYKRLIIELKRIEKLDDPILKEQERLVEERTFELFHNPRLVDRRRFNAGVTCLFATLLFFSSFSIIKTFIDIPTNVLTGLTVIAIGCVLSFGIMAVPFNLPAFFDYEFLPDLHAPEALVDKPANEQEEDEKNSEGEISGSERDRQPLVKNEKRKPTKSSSPIANNNNSEYDCIDAGVEISYDEGRASSYLPQRASVAGNSAPIAVPEGLNPDAIPSVSTKFLESIKDPIIWCFWLTFFAMTGANGVLNGNQAQILTAANGGLFDQKLNSLTVALYGIGSACGRIIVGMLETLFHRRNAILREKQLVWLAENGVDTNDVETLEGAVNNENVLNDKPNMIPIHHRLNSSVLCFLPLPPLVLGASSILCAVLPVQSYPALFWIAGASYGSSLSLTILGVREIFSVDVAQHYNFVTAAGMLASVLLNRLMFGMWYDDETKSHLAADGISCAGYSCFADSLYVCAAICFCAVFSSAFVTVRWWKIRQTF